MLAMLAGVLIDVAIGWPARLYARIGHPVTWLGALISALDTRLNDGPRAARLRMGALKDRACAAKLREVKKVS